MKDTTNESNTEGQTEAQRHGFTKLARIEYLPLGTPFIFAYEMANHVPYADTGHKVVVKTLSTDKTSIAIIEQERYKENVELEAAGVFPKWSPFPWGYHLVQQGWVSPEVEELKQKVWTLSDRREAQMDDLAERICALLSTDECEMLKSFVGYESAFQGSIALVLHRRSNIEREVAA